jgi:hypothetical protein
MMVLILTAAAASAAREIHLPEEGALIGNVLIAERFEETVGRNVVPIQFQAWPGKSGLRDATWFTVRIEAHPGDVLILAPGAYEAEIWVFVRGITLMTDPESEELATIHGTIEIDADRVTLERVGVTNSSDPKDSGHGIEVNGDEVDTIIIRDCVSSGNRWTGIHMIGTSGTIREMRVENCELNDNGMDGLDAKHMTRLVITGCTITGNGWDLANGVGVRIGHYVEEVVLEDNVIENNRSADVYYAQ